MKYNKQQWLNELDEITIQFRDSFSSLSPEQLNQKSGTGRWNIAENILHIIIVNESYFPIIEAVKEGSYKDSFIGRFDFITSLFGNMVYKSVLPDCKRKIKTFNMWEPGKKAADGQFISRFLEHQEELKRRISEMSDEELEKTIASPANRNIVYKLHRAIDIIVQHERRHYMQAKEVMEQLEVKGEAV